MNFFVKTKHELPGEDRGTILVAMDSPVYRTLVRQALSDQGYRLLYADSGVQAVQLCEQHRPAAVILDGVLSDSTGVEVCARLRRLREFYTYVIILSAKSDKPSLVAGFKAGADDYVAKPFHDEELQARIGVGLRIVELQRKVEARNACLLDLAMTDGLTSLPNRRAVEEWTTRELSGAIRHGFSFWVVMADIDRFKEINDSFGHAAGDEVLRKFAEVVRRNSRRSDICGRVGGEEFLMVITRATQRNAIAVVERIRTELQSTSFHFRGRELSVTASFGIAGFQHNRGAVSLEQLRALADRALYAAKRSGRNRVEAAPALAD